MHLLQTHVRSKRARALLLHAATDDTDALLRTCRPWSTDDYSTRVETYTALRWFSKPTRLSPLQCARFGWICHASDALRCVSCHASCAPNDDDDAPESLPHARGCPWTQISCPIRFASAPMDADGMRRQYRAALPRLFRLRRVPALAPDSLARHLRVLRALPLYANFECPVVEKCDTLRCLAVYGWSASADGESLLCELCRRSVRVADVIAIDDIVAELPAERRESPLFDPLSEHRAFCPWSQNAVAEMLAAFGGGARSRRAAATSSSQANTIAAQAQHVESLATLRAVKRLLTPQ